MKDGAPAHGYLPTVFRRPTEAASPPTDRALHERVQLPNEVVLRRGAPDVVVLQRFLEALQHLLSLDPLVRTRADRQDTFLSRDVAFDERGVCANGLRTR